MQKETFKSFNAFDTTQKETKLRFHKTNNWGDFTFVEFKSFNNLHYSKREITTTAYNPSSNGSIKRYSKTLCVQVRCTLS